VSYRQRTTEKAALFIVSTALWAVSIVLFLSGHHYTVLRWFALGFAFIGYAGVFVADWQDELRLRRHIANEQALSHERAKIIGDYVHRMGGSRNDG
jgi:poly-beta-hydroxyalkanoate depolymerase